MTQGLIQLKKDIIRLYGVRCSRFDSACLTCDAWALYDRVKEILTAAD